MHIKYKTRRDCLFLESDISVYVGKVKKTRVCFVSEEE